jgi:NAD(P)-dependent dehydrogenase (short-subunit alcohol dehydrogenase family)
MSDLLEGRVALVTGGGSGIGRAAALALAHAGARVAVADVAHAAAVETVELLETEGLALACDVGSASDVAATVARVVERFGQLDCAFNNAGIEGGPPDVQLHEYAEDIWDRVVEVDLKGVWLCLKYELAVMVPRGSGAIVNTSSISGLTGGGNTAYVAAKHGVMGLTRKAALEYGPLGIRVNAVCPGPIRTPMLERLFKAVPERETRLAEAAALRRLGRPEDVAAAVVWLLSDAASFVTGHGLVVDGGYLAR